MSVKSDLAALCEIEARLAALGVRRDDLRRGLLSVALDQLAEQGGAPTWRTGLGTVGLTVPKPSPSVVDRPAFEAFLLERYGEEAFETVRSPKHDAVDALVAECSVTGTAALVTPDGEQVPGMTAMSRPPFLFVRLSKEAKLGAAIDLETGPEGAPKWPDAVSERGSPRKDPEAAYQAFMGMGESEWKGLLRSLMGGGVLEHAEQVGFERAMKERRPGWITASDVLEGHDGGHGPCRLCGTPTETASNDDLAR